MFQTLSVGHYKVDSPGLWHPSVVTPKGRSLLTILSYTSHLECEVYIGTSLDDQNDCFWGGVAS